MVCIPRGSANADGASTMFRDHRCIAIRLLLYNRSGTEDFEMLVANRRIARLLSTAVNALLAVSGARATLITDPDGDYVSGYSGNRSGDLDVELTLNAYDATTQKLVLHRLAERKRRYL